MTVRRFLIGQTEGVEFADGRVVLGTVPAQAFDDVAACEEVVGPLQWVDAERPTWSTAALLSVPAPGVVSEGTELVRLLTHVTGFRAPVWIPALVVWTCRVAHPHLQAAFPWLDEEMARWPAGGGDETGTAVRRWAAAARRRHPGPHSVEPMTPREVNRRVTVLRVAAARPWPSYDALRV